MAALGASQEVMLTILRRNNVPCADRKTLRKSFRAELKQGRDYLITTLGLRMVRPATTDGPHSFSACAFLLRTWGDPQWRVPKDSDDDLHAASAAAAAGGNGGVRIYIPHNHRDDNLDLPIEPAPPPTIDAEPEPEPDSSGT